MKKILFNIYLFFDFIFFTIRELFRGSAKAFGQAFNLNNASIEQDVNQRLKEIQQMSAEQTYMHWLGLLSYEQTKRRHIIEGKTWDVETGEVRKDGEYTEEEKKAAQEEWDLIQMDIFDMTDVYSENKENIFQFVKEKQEQPMFTPVDLVFEDGVTKVVYEDGTEITLEEEH